jgi:hypothetical protein
LHDEVTGLLLSSASRPRTEKRRRVVAAFMGDEELKIAK